MLTEQERRSHESNVRNCKDREAEIEAKLRTIPAFAPRHSKLLGKLNETLQSRLCSEALLKEGDKAADDPIRAKAVALVKSWESRRLIPDPEKLVGEMERTFALPRLFMLCTLHSTPGEPILAVVKQLDSASVMLVCPACIEMGKALREKTGMQLGRRDVAVQAEVEKPEGKHGLAPSPEVK